MNQLAGLLLNGSKEIEIHIGSILFEDKVLHKFTNSPMVKAVLSVMKILYFRILRSALQFWPNLVRIVLAKFAFQILARPLQNLTKLGFHIHVRMHRVKRNETRISLSFHPALPVL